MAARSMKEIDEAVEKLRELQSDPLIAELAFKRDLAEMDRNEEKRIAREEKEAAVREAQKEGRAIGMAEGRAEGRAETSFEIAKAMKQKGIDIKMILEITGISKEQIEKI